MRRHPPGVGVEDVARTGMELHEHVWAGHERRVADALPRGVSYPLPAVAARIGADGADGALL